MKPSLALLVVFASCAGSKQNLPQIGNQAALPRPVQSYSMSAHEIWQSYQTLTASEFAPEPQSVDDADYERWRREVWRPEMRGYLADVSLLQEPTADLAAGTVDEQLFAAIVYAKLHERAARASLELRGPESINRDPVFQTRWDAQVLVEARPVARKAINAYHECELLAPSASTSMRHWTADCRRAAQALEDLLITAETN